MGTDNLKTEKDTQGEPSKKITSRPGEGGVWPLEEHSAKTGYFFVGWFPLGEPSKFLEYKNNKFYGDTRLFLQFIVCYTLAYFPLSAFHKHTILYK